MFSNPFILPTEQYKRNIDPVGQYVEQAANYLHITRHIPLSEARDFVVKSIKGKKFPTIKNPTVKYLERQPNGDREKLECRLTEYINSSLKNKEIIAPTLTTYTNPSVKESLLVKYIDKNIKRRGKAKKEMFAAIAGGDKYLSKVKDQEQNNMKTRNNSLSGAQASKSTPISNKTAHSTLTSNCRTSSGYGNANNEKLLAGNRHYWAVDIVINNVISIVTNTDYKQLQEFISVYRIHIPTLEETIACVRRSTDLYWKDKLGHDRVFSLLEKLNDLQRAAFVYTGDFYHFAKYNRGVALDFIKGISTKVQGKLDNHLEYLKKSNGAIVDLGRSICINEIAGIDKEYRDSKKNDLSNSDRIHILACTVKLINDTLLKHELLIKTLFVSDNVPASVAYIPSSIRRVALTSDTDSTIFTVMDWVFWYYNEPYVKPGDPVAAAMIFLAAQTITHILARTSANFGVVPEKLFQIEMKNEYKFDVYVPTSVAKHYFAIKNVQEGIILDPIQYEIKGVHLKNSNAPAIINEKALSMMKKILHTVADGKKIKIIDFLTEVADIERDIYSKILEGSPMYLRHGVINTPSSYTNPPMESPYMYHDLWVKVFSEKYGTFNEPPYSTIRISTDLISPTVTKQWLENIEDKELALRMKNWLSTNDKNKLPSIMIPVEAIRLGGIPQEILKAMDVRRIVANITKTFYLILETLGFYMINDKNTKLVSDFY